MIKDMNNLMGQSYYIYYSVIDEWAHSVIYILELDCRMGPSYSIYIRV